MARLAEVLNLLPAARRNNARNWAVYTLLWLPLAASAANAKATTTTQDASDFIAMRIKAYVTDTATPPVENATPQATLLLSIGDASFMPDNNALHIEPLSCSSGWRDGHELEFPIYVQRNTNLVGQLTNLTATAMNVRLHIFGLRIFDYEAGTRGI